MAQKDFKVKNGIVVNDSSTFLNALTVQGTMTVSNGHDLAVSGNITGKYAGFDSDFNAKSTADLSEGSNLYYTTVRVDSDIVASIGTDPVIAGVSFYNESSGGISIGQDVNLGDSTTSVLNYAASDSGKSVALGLTIPNQVSNFIGVTGNAASNDLIIGYEGANTELIIKSGVGKSPTNLGGGTTLATLGTTGILTLTSAQQSTNKTTGSIVTAGGIGADKDVRAENFVAVNNITAGTNGTGKFIGDVTGTVSDISNHTTTDLTEGTNLYYTTVRFDSDLGATTTSGLPEGSNLYYTTARADSDAKRAISVNNTSGFGSLAYVDSTGVISYTGISTAQIRSQFSAGTGVTLSSGQISIGQDVGLTDSVQFAAGTFSGNVTVDGDLTVGGSYILNEQNDLRVTNALIKLADSNTGDAVDIGIVGRYSEDAGVTIRRAGFFRDATNGEWYTFNNLVQDGLDSNPADQTINRADASFELGTWNFKALRGSYLGFDSDFRVFSTNYTEYDSDFTAVSAGRYAINTTGGPVTVTLPSSPTTGDYVRLIDISNWTDNSVTLNRNGSTIESTADNFELDIGQSIIELIYINSTWQVYSSIGQRGAQGAKGDSADVTNFASPSQAIAYSIALG
jgi:hypothetical protein